MAFCCHVCMLNMAYISTTVREQFYVCCVMSSIYIYIWRLEEKHVECIFHCTNSVLVVLEEEMVDDSEWVGSIATNERTHVTADDTQTRENMLSSRRIRTSMSSINWLE